MIFVVFEVLLCFYSRLFNKSPVTLPQMGAVALSGRNVPLVVSVFIDDLLVSLL